MSIVAERLRRQRLTGAACRTPDALVSWMGAVQAQEFEHALWGIGQRMPSGTTRDRVEAAFARGDLLRTHVLRPTWHFVTPDDIRWMLGLTAPRIQRQMQPYNRALNLDARTLTRSMTIIERELGSHRHRTRLELSEALAQAGIVARSQRLGHLMMHAELEGLVCSGPRRGRQFTYALLEERAPRHAPIDRDEALARLAHRFFQSHGPATLRDFAWWSGLTVADGRRAVEMIRAAAGREDGLDYWTAGAPPRVAPTAAPVRLLPIYDEYIVAYRDRVAVPHVVTATTQRTEALIFQHALIAGGQVAGTWRTPTGRQTAVTTHPLRRLTATERRALDAGLARYAAFTAGSGGGGTRVRGG